MLQWAAAYFTYQRSVRLITRNPLRRIARGGPIDTE